MKVAYLIIAHNNPAHLKRLVDALNSDDVSFFIHIDRKVTMQLSFNGYDNVHILENRVAVNWGGYSLVEAALLLLKAAYATDNFDYYVLMSGADYPIRSNQYIQSFFTNNNMKSFINVIKMPGDFKKFERLDYYHLEGGNSRERNKIKGYGLRSIDLLIKYLHIKRKYPKEYSHYIMYGGTTWWAFHRNFVTYLLNFLDNNPVFFNFYKHALFPDEMLFHTIIMNSPFRESVANGLTYDDWTIDHHPQFLISEKHLPIFNQELIDGRYGLSMHLFARKFTDDSTSLLNEIEKIRNTLGYQFVANIEKELIYSHAMSNKRVGTY
jgi:hypothetical protein